ncbi:adenylyltransferase/cytidyltransferase family protein [Candidatus Daviesbacteria bacterium]|nr:adenylyltransferase/cytidyltransferase family protein [Candidatus Daviesbacteria bacterium]
MGKVISVNKLGQVVRELKKQDKKIVLAGGCFDILHPGHVTFLEKAKKAGEILFVFLESDKKVQELKGANRPIHTQTMRAKVLSALRVVDYVVRLPYMGSSKQYDEVVGKIKPDVIAATTKDANIHHQRAAKLVGASFEVVAKVVKEYSTSRLVDVRF